MSLWRLLGLALTALTRSKTRSLLTVLGVIIGVAAVIAMVSIGEGAKARVASTFSAMGTDTLVLTSGSSTFGGVRGGAGSRQTLTWDDLEAIRALPEIAHAAPQLRKNTQIVAEAGNWQTTVYGTTPEFLQLFNLKDLTHLPTLKEMEEITLPDIPGETVALDQVEES